MGMKKYIEANLDGTLVQQCYDQLLDDIIEGVYKPGEKLKVAPLKDRLSVGQSPVREALSRLVSCGMVEVQDNKGFFVTSICESDIRDIYQAFTEIENLLLKLAIQKGDDSWQANIVGQLYKLSLIENQVEAISQKIWMQRNYDFHLALIVGCNSPVLLDIRYNLYLKFDRYCRMSYKLRKDALSLNHGDHQDLVQAVLQRDVKKSQDLMSYHINAPLEDIIQQLRHHGMI